MADFGSDGFEGVAELVELDGKTGESEGLFALVAVLGHDGMEDSGRRYRVARPIPVRAATASKVTSSPLADRSVQAFSTRAGRSSVTRPGLVP